MKKIRVISWTLFDFAETVFSANIISVFFPLWIVNFLGGSSYHYSFVYSLSIIFSIFLGIITGKIADERGLKDIFFKSFVAGVIFLLFSLYFVDSLVMALIIFFFMNISYQQSLIFYNSLLEDVSGDKKGAVSGTGIGIGYIGGVVSLLIANYLSKDQSDIFFITAVIFAVFSIPAVLFVKSKGISRPVKIKNILKDRKFFIFLVSILFLTDAAHGLIIFMSIYLNKVFSMDQSQVVNVIAFAGVFAIIWAPLCGILLDRIRPVYFLKYLFIGWMSAFVFLFLSDEKTIYLVSVLFGILLASLWTTLRVVLIQISPKEELSTRFAFMALSERMASILSPLTWGAVVLIFGESVSSYKAAALILGVFPLLGFFIYLRFLKSI